MEETSHIEFFLGESLHTVEPKDVTPETSLNTYLRDKIHLTGTKRCCLEGGCGACVVAVEHTDPISGITKFFAVNSCLVSIFSCHQWKIHTIEGIGGPLTDYHPLQKKLAEGHGSQCGYCSGGMVMNMFALMKEKGKLSETEIENSFGGNTCRCTGYRPILESFKSLALTDIEDLEVCKKDCDSECKTVCTKKLVYKDGNSSWTKLYKIKDLMEILGSIQDSYMLVSGNTSKGVYRPISTPKKYIDVSSIAELLNWTLTDNSLSLGANVSLSETMNLFKKISSLKEQFKYFSHLAEHLDLVANIPVRNIGTLAGNLMIKHAHPEFQSDIFLILETVNASIVIADPSGTEIITSPALFLKTNMSKKVIKNIILPGYDSSYVYKSYKIMQRAQNTPAVVNAGFLLKINSGVVKSARIVYGGINPNFIHATKTEELLINKNLFDNETLKQALHSLSAEINPDHVLPDADPKYRKELAIALFYKFVLNIAPAKSVSDKYKSGGKLLERPVSSGSQEFTQDKNIYPVSENVGKIEALAQTSGQADYIEDIPDLPGQLFGSFAVVKAPAGSVITKIDSSKALKLAGVVKFLGKDDIPGKNIWSPTNTLIFFADEYLFCEGTVLYFDQPVGIVVANSQELADQAAELIEVTCTPPKSKPLLDIRDVLKAPEDEKKKRVSHQTDFVRKTSGNDVRKVVKGDFYIGSQYHFHMETQVCNVVPVCDGLDVYASTQWMDCNQIAIATVLNLKNTQVNLKVKRLGGAFGAKIMRNAPVSCATALAAHLLRKPVKMRMSFEKNMRILGKRFPCYVDYEAGVNSTGIIQYLNANIYSDFGVGANEPIDLLIVDMFQNGYICDTWQFSTYVVTTDKPPNCYTRAPGTKEGLCAIESIMEHIASSIGVDAYEMKMANTDKTKHSMLVDFTKEMMAWGDIAKRKQDIQKFNEANRWTKRGISLTPMAYILEVAANYVSLVSIFHGDGSVAIAHGGVEMGQGINTKVAQVAAYKLGIPMELIQVKASNSMCNPNNTATGGSLTSEAVSYAVTKACDILLERMAPIKKKMTNPKWLDVVKSCFENSVNLSANSFYSPLEPSIKQYLIYGLAAAEVEVDILTGKNEILQVDILEDVGQSMNPLIDVGQLEGALVMGIGYYLTEQIIYNENGQILTDRTWTYKVPGPKDIPVKFRVKFPPNVKHDYGVLQSKAIAEPPSCLSAAIPLAIRNAVASARKNADPTKPLWYPFDGCSSIENTFLNSLNDFTQYKLN